MFLFIYFEKYKRDISKVHRSRIMKIILIKNNGFIKVHHTYAVQTVEIMRRRNFAPMTDNSYLHIIFALDSLQL